MDRIILYKNEDGTYSNKAKSGDYEHRIVNQGGEDFLYLKVALKSAESKKGVNYQKGTMNYAKDQDGTAVYTNISAFKNTSKNGNDYISILISDNKKESLNNPKPKAYEAAQEVFGSDEISF